MPIVYPQGGTGGGGGGSGTVTNVSSPDTSIVVTNPTTTPSLKVATLDVIAANEPPAADWSNNSHRITSVTDPASAQDAATKNYVDAAVNGLTWKAAVQRATAAALPANTYNNGASGVGATLTAVGVGALTIDGGNPAVGDRVLVKNEVTGSHNGIYTVTVAGSGIAAYVLTRATDYNQASELAAGDAVYVISGTANTDTSWVLTTQPPYTIGTTALAYVQFGGNAVASVFGRTGAVVAVNADYMGIVAAALTGATAATRYVGGTASGPPTSGTFAVGDFVVDQTAQVWVCTVAGTPGTWTQAGMPTILSASSTTLSDGSVTPSTYVDVTSTDLTFTPVVTSSALCFYTAGMLFNESVDVRLRQRFVLDGGTPREGIFLWSPSGISQNRLSQSMMTLYSGLSVASHTIKVQQAFDVFAGDGVGIPRTQDRTTVVMVFPQ